MLRWPWTRQKPERKTILLVDDEPEYLEQMKQLLEDRGIIVLIAEYAGEAKEVAEEHSEIAMTFMDGLVGAAFTLTKELKQMQAGGILVAHSSDEGVNHYMQEDGCDLVLQKRGKHVELADKIAALLDTQPTA